MVYVSISSGVQRFGDLRTLEILISERHNTLLVKLASRMNYGFIVSFSVAFFLNQISSFLDRNRIKYTPNSVGDNVYLNWKWRNFLISFIHALITGIGSLIWYVFFLYLQCNVDVQLQACEVFQAFLCLDLLLTDSLL